MGRRLLDLFAGAGVGAGQPGVSGYARHFDEIVAIDTDLAALAANPHHTICANALVLLHDHRFLNGFDAIHASPPCQGFTAARELAIAQGKGRSKKAVDLLTPTAVLLRKVDVPWVVENVERSPMRRLMRDHHVTRLCGSMFGLKVQRHRLFGTNIPLPAPPPCDHASFDIDPDSHKPRPWGIYYAPGDRIPSGGRTCDTLDHAKECMGVDREISWDHLKEGIPPAYTDWIGSHLAAAIEGRAAA